MMPSDSRCRAESMSASGSRGHRTNDRARQTHKSLGRSVEGLQRAIVKLWRWMWFRNLLVHEDFDEKRLVSDVLHAQVVELRGHLAGVIAFMEIFLGV